MKAPSTLKSFNCPVCQTQMVESIGNSLHPNDPKFGVTLSCPAPHPEVCSAQEVSGHGSNAQNAFEIVTSKFPR